MRGQVDQPERKTSNGYNAPITKDIVPEVERARFTLWARVLYDAQCAAGEKIKVSIVPSLSGCDMGLQQRYAKIRDDLIKEHTRGRGCDDPRLLVAFRDAWETIGNMDTNEDAWTKSFEQGARVSFE